jgi:hypothetical protein
VRDEWAFGEMPRQPEQTADGYIGDRRRPRRPCSAWRRSAAILSLGAAPAFLAMAVLTWSAPAAPDLLCMAGGRGLPGSGMVPMYLLMSVVHLPAWLRFLARQRPDALLTPG